MAARIMAKLKASSIAPADWPAFVARAIWRMDAPPPPLRPYAPPPDAGLTVLYEDEACFALAKPSGLLAVDGIAEGKQDSLASRAAARFAFCRPVHRLDCDTSGVMLFAKGARMQGALQKQFAQRRTAKRYLALVAQAPEAEVGEIEGAMLADWPNRPRQMVHPEGRPALTRWRAARRGSPALMALEPVTGRSHQLRVHLAMIGCPILGDDLYGGADAARLMLHAQSLRFESPASGPVTVEDPAPFN